MKKILSVALTTCLLLVCSMFVFTACKQTKQLQNTASVSIYQDFNGDVYAEFFTQNVPSGTTVSYKTSLQQTWQTAQHVALLATQAELQENEIQTISVSYRVNGYEMGKTTYTQSPVNTAEYNILTQSSQAQTFAQSGILFLNIPNITADIPDNFDIGFTDTETANLVAQTIQAQAQIPQFVAMAQENGKLFIKKLQWNQDEGTFRFVTLNETNLAACMVAQTLPNQQPTSLHNLKKVEITAEGISLSNFTKTENGYELYFIMPASTQTYAYISNVFTVTLP